VARRTRRKHGESPDRRVSDEPQLLAEGANGAPVPEGPKDSEKSVEPVEPDKPRKKRKRRSRAGARCPVCGRSGEPAADAGRVRCGTCGATFPKARPALGEVAKARDRQFSRAFARPNSEERGVGRSHAGEVMRGFFNVLKGKPAVLNAFGKSVLEVNCGLGFRLRAFQGYGWAVAGTETSATAYEYSRRQSLEVTHGWLADGRFGRARFDLALFCGSFGEMDDPHRTAKQLLELLVLHGLVCVMREPMAGDEEAAPDDSRLFLHTPESVKRAFTRNKFSLVSEELAEGVGTFWFRSKARK